MKFLRDMNDKMAPMFNKGEKLERLYPLFEAHDTGSFTPGLVTKSASHIRDALDQKRMMIAVVFALLPCFLMAMFNTGYQANVATSAGATALQDWHTSLYQLIGFSYAQAGTEVGFFSVSNFVLGAIFFLPVYITTLAVGGLAEVAICIIRKHPITEGFLVTSALFPLILPATIPLWQVALGILFGVVIGKEIFGGVGMNILNPALTARAFLFFAYPAQISGDVPWLPYNVDSISSGISALPNPMMTEGGVLNAADATSSATYLSLAANPESTINWSDSSMAMFGSEWMNAFYGLVPGSMGETSVLACLIGAAILIVTKIASWRTMLGITLGTAATALLLNGIATPDSTPMLSMPWYWHFVVGGWAFGAVFMATDPVSSPFTEKGKFIYGLFIGFMVVLIRCVNPAYAEGMMLAILFMNMFSPLIDHFIVQGNIKRRLQRDVA